MIPVDLDLARRLEAIETWVAGEFGRSRLALWPGRDTEVLEVAGGVACFLGEGSNLNEARGLGMLGAVTLEEIEAVERVSLSRGIVCKINVCSLADPSLLEGLAVRGFRAVGFEDVLYRELGASETFADPTPGIELSPGDSEADAEICGDVLARGFSAPEEPNQDMREMFQISARVEGLSGRLARLNGEPAGAGSVLIRDGMAMLCGAATLPEYRNRGVQTALSHARLAQAAQAGCSLITVTALPGSTSHKNAQRLGFRVAYTKVALQRDPG